VKSVLLNRRALLQGLLAALFISLLTACAPLPLMEPEPAPISEEPAVAVVILSEPAQPRSELIYIDATGRTTARQRLEAQGILQIEEAADGSLLLPVPNADRLIRVAPGGQLEEERVAGQPVFFMEADGAQLALYHASEASGVIEVQANGEVQSVEVSGLPWRAVADGEHIFVYAGLVEEQATVLHILSRQPLTLQDTVSLHDYAATHAMAVADGRLLIGAQTAMAGVPDPAHVRQSLLVYDPTSPLLDDDTQAPFTIVELPEEAEQPYGPIMGILPGPWQLHLVTHDGAIVSVERETLAISNVIWTEQAPVLSARLYADTIYLLSHRHEPDGIVAGQIRNYDLMGGMVINDWSIVPVPGLLPQDFALLGVHADAAERAVR
jgi:hypothetical protein